MIGVSTKRKIGKLLHQAFPGEAAHLETAFRRVWFTGNPLSGEELTARFPSRPEKCIWLLNFYPVKENLDKSSWLPPRFPT